MTRATVRRLLLVVAMTAGFTSLGGGPAWACSCAAGTPQEYVEWSDVVFTGTVAEVTREETGSGDLVGVGRVTAALAVETVYKGTVPGEASVVTAGESGACGYNFHEERRYTIFASEGRRIDLTTSLCSGNVRGSIEPAKYGFESGQAPPGGLAFTGPEPWTRSASIAGAVAAILGLGILLVVRRPYRARVGSS